MSRIYNTQFNNISGSTKGEQKVQFVQDTYVNAIPKKNLYITTGDQNYELATALVQFYRVFADNALPFFINISANRTIFWGEDSSAFVATLIETFGLSPDIPGLTDNITINFYGFTTPVSPPTPINHNVYLGTTSNTTNFVSFENIAGGGASTTALLFKSSDTGPKIVPVTITVTNFTGGSEQATINWTN